MVGTKKKLTTFQNVNSNRRFSKENIEKMYIQTEKYILSMKQKNFFKRTEDGKMSSKITAY